MQPEDTTQNLGMQVVSEWLEQEQSLPDFHSIALRLALKDETEIAPALNLVHCQVGGRIGIKSYPVSLRIPICAYIYSHPQAIHTMCLQLFSPVHVPCKQRLGGRACRWGQGCVV